MSLTAAEFSCLAVPATLSQQTFTYFPPKQTLVLCWAEPVSNRGDWCLRETEEFRIYHVHIQHQCNYGAESLPGEESSEGSGNTTSRVLQTLEMKDYFICMQ